MYDVAIIGAGVIGASIFRELTKYDLKVALIEKENDVAMGTTKANSAIVHAGYDPKVGTLMAKYNVKGNEMFEELCKELSVPFKRNGSLVLAFDDEDMKKINNLYINGNENGVKGLKILNRDEVLKMEPNLNKNIKGALFAPTGGIVGPFEYTLALVENGVKNGGEILLNSEVKSIKKDCTFVIETTDGKEVTANYVINAAGVYADKIHNLICSESFKIHPRKGEYYVMDKSEGALVEHTIFQCPSKLGKGILVTPTVHGNLLVGPNAVDLEDKESLSTTGDGLNEVKKEALKTTEKINFRNGFIKELIRFYDAGIFDVAVPVMINSNEEIIKGSRMSKDELNKYLNKMNEYFETSFYEMYEKIDDETNEIILEYQPKIDEKIIRFVALNNSNNFPISREDIKDKYGIVSYKTNKLLEN